MDNKIIKRPDFTVERDALDPDNYTATLLSEGKRLGIVSDDDARRFIDGVASLLAETITVQSGGESTSVKQETAEKIVESIVYCVNVSLLCKPTPEIALETLIDDKTENIYYDGLHILRVLQKRADILRLLLIRTKKPDMSRNYYRFIDHTVPQYLRRYDPKTLANAVVYVCLPELEIDKNICGLFDFYNVMNSLLSFNKS